jgi:neurofibromin 1
LVENVAWGEICTLARLNLMLAFNPTSSLDTQLFLPDLVHIITILLGAGPLLMRQTVYGLLVNIVQSLISTAPTDEMDGSALLQLMRKSQQPEMMAQFGLMQSPGSLELSSMTQREEADAMLLNPVEEVARFLGDILRAGAVSTGRWYPEPC